MRWLTKKRGWLGRTGNDDSLISASTTNLRLDPRWSSLDELIAAHSSNLRLDLGCGFVKPPGFIGLDNGSGVKLQEITDNTPDIYLDLERSSLPFDDNTVEEVRASHFLEHVDDLDHVLSETHRVLRPGGTFLFAIPYANSWQGLRPEHLLYLTEDFFDNDKGFHDLFVITNVEWFPTPDWEKLPQSLRDELGFDLARRVMFNVCWQMMVWTTPRKGDWNDAPRRTCAEAVQACKAASA